MGLQQENPAVNGNPKSNYFAQDNDSFIIGSFENFNLNDKNSHHNLGFDGLRN